MKKLYKFLRIIAIGAVIAAASILAACDNGSTSGGCKGDGACYYIRSNGDYKWCGAESCAVWKTSDTGQASISCNCK